MSPPAMRAAPRWTYEQVVPLPHFALWNRVNVCLTVVDNTVCSWGAVLQGVHGTNRDEVQGIGATVFHMQMIRYASYGSDHLHDALPDIDVHHSFVAE